MSSASRRISDAPLPLGGSPAGTRRTSDAVPLAASTGKVSVGGGAGEGAVFKGGVSGLMMQRKNEATLRALRTEQLFPPLFSCDAAPSNVPKEKHSGAA